MKIKIVEKVKTALRSRLYRFESWVIGKSAPLTKKWLKLNDPWGLPTGTPRERARYRVAAYLWARMPAGMQEDVVFSSAFERPTEWNCDKQVAIEARIHGRPIVDPEQPMTTEPAREVLDPNGKLFKVVMKRAPAPELPKPARTARKRKTRKAA